MADLNLQNLHILLLVSSAIYELDILEALPVSLHLFHMHLKLREPSIISSLHLGNNAVSNTDVILLVERIFSDGLRTADGVEMLSIHLTATDEQSDYKQRLQHFDDSCEFSSGQRHNLYPEGRLIAEKMWQ